MMFKKSAFLGLLLFVFIAVVMTCSAAEMLQRIDFKDGKSLPWVLSESDEQNSYSLIRDGKLIVHVDQKGASRWDVQLRHREISIVEGHTYTVKFQVTADRNCKIYAKIGDQREPYWEAWNNNNEPFSVTAGQTLTVDRTFTAVKSSQYAEFSFYLGGDLSGSLPNEIKFISMSLGDADFSPTPIPTPTPVRDILVNQLGYFTHADKKATLRDNLLSAPVRDWQLKNCEGIVVASGKTKPFGPDLASGDTVQIIDFSNFTTPGKNYQLVAGTAVSFPFDIGNDIYSEMKYNALKFFYHARSGIDIKMPYCVESKWARPAGHTDDTAVLIAGRNYNGPSEITASGGWYDAGDHGKYVVHGGLALWILQNQYEHSLKSGRDAQFTDGKLNIPESENSKSDLMDETRWEMEWMLKMQIPTGFEKEGMAAHRLADESWTSLGTSPHQDNEKRIYYPPSTAATLNLAACAAQAARIWKDIDSRFSSTCLTSAETAYTAAKKNPAVFASYGQEQGSKTYGDNYVEDDFYWAACELYVATGKKEYLEDLKGYKGSLQMPVILTGELSGIAGSFDWCATGGLGTLTLALHKSAEFPEVVESIKKAADTFLAVQANEGYGIPLAESTNTSEFNGYIETATGYPWGSNGLVMNEAIVMAYAFDLSHKVEYFNGMSEAMDYLMGRNPLVKAFVSGYGENPVRNPYHRFFCPQMVFENPPVPPGFVVSGPNSYASDPWATGGDRRIPTQKRYEDNAELWQYNEVSISLNASLAWITYFMDTYGGSGCCPTKVPTTPTPTYSGVVEDINKDGAINISDVVIIAKAFGSVYGDAKFDSRCDLTNDGAITMADVMRLALRFGFVYM